MRVRRLLIGGMMVVGLLLATATAAGAASVSVTPGTVGYGDKPVVKVTGLAPNTTYLLQIYDHFGLPIIPVPFTIKGGADGTYTTLDLTPDPTDQPGVFTFEVSTQDGKLVARATATLTGTNTYYVQHRLGA